MNQLRIAALAHNARNRLTSAITRLEDCGCAGLAQELHTVSSQLLTVQALLRAEQQAGVQYYEVDLESFFSDLVAEAQLLAPSHLALSTQADFSAAPFPLWTFDAPLIRLALLDALANAWRHGRTRVGLEAFIEEGLLVFAVTDDGPGFPEAYLGDTDALPPSPLGSGQGLAMARRIAIAHEVNGSCGEVHLSNEGGAVFRLCLP